MKPKSRTGLTKKEGQMLRKMIADPMKTQTEAAREVYDTKHPAYVGYEVMQRPRVKRVFKEMLELAGVDASFKASKTRELLDAKDERGNPNYPVQFQTLKYVSQIEGDFAPTRHETKKLSLNVSEKLFKDLDEGNIK